MVDLFSYSRRTTHPVQIGELTLGSDHPVRVQSMTTTDTMDTEASAAQVQRIVEAGGEMVRLTTQGKKEAENMAHIKELLSQRGIRVPLVADVHFNANVADVAARCTDKVRVNPGNYVDPARQFIKHTYTDEEYAGEVQKLEERFKAFLDICREHGTAVRVGVNHGSLSDRIRNRYGDTPAGIVESCLEMLRVCKREHFDNVVVSIKASNTVVMVQSVRLLVDAMEREGMTYPIHLGVTEAGEGEDGRIKSAVGIGALLADGIGDTIRVSLSEAPEAEIPVARSLVNHFAQRAGHTLVPGASCPQFSWLHPQRRTTQAVANVGGGQVPVVIVSSAGQDVEVRAQDGHPRADYVYLGAQWPEHWSGAQRPMVDYQVMLQRQAEGLPVGQACPVFPASAMPFVGMVQADVKFLVLQFGTPTEEYLACLRQHPEVVVVCMSRHANPLADRRALVLEMMASGVTNPVVMAQMHHTDVKEELQLAAAADMGALMMDGLVDGLWLLNDGAVPAEEVEATAFGILQAGRLRMTRTEYISCPGCGRTLYDLQSTVARIRKATGHLKGLKIGVMGCIVNGPGEMADADYGYVGAGPRKVSLYRGQECVERNIPEDEAVERLLRLIEADGKG